MGRWLIAAVAVAGCDREALDPTDFDDPRQSTFVPVPDVGEGSDFVQPADAELPPEAKVHAAGG